MSVQLSFAVLACHGIWPSSHLSERMHRIVMVVNHQIVFGTKAGYILCLTVLFKGIAIHKAVFHTGGPPLPILGKSLLDRIVCAGYIVQVEPDPYSLLLAVLYNTLYVTCFVALGRVRILLKLRAVPVGIEQQALKALLCGKINHPDPRVIIHAVPVSLPDRSVNTPVPQIDTRPHPAKIHLRFRI